MAVMRATPPEGRYGRSTDARADRRLKVIGGVLGVVLLAVVGWLGYSYLSGQDVNGRVIGFKVVSDESVQAHLEVHKDKGATGVCTMRSLAEDGGEVGRKDFTFDEPRKQVDKVVTLRTTRRATNAELVECKAASDG